MSDVPFKIRDLHKKQQYIVDDVYLDKYAKIIGPSGTAVYNSLCRRVDKNQFCFPSEKLIAKDHHMSPRTVGTYIKRLAEAGIIEVMRRKSLSGKKMCNGYTLLDSRWWRKPEEIVAYGYRRKAKAYLEENNDENHAQPLPNKDAQLKDAHVKEFEEIRNKRRVISQGMEMLPNYTKAAIQEEAAREDRIRRSWRS